MRGQVKIYQKKLAARRRKRALLLSLYSAAAAGIILCFFSYISQLDSLSINKIEISGNNRLSSSTIEAIVGKDLIGNYFGFFSPRNFLLYPKSQIRADVAALPLVKSVNISLDGIHTMKISVTERTETAYFCVDSITEDTSDCYSVDENGFVFAPTLFQTDVSTTITYRGLITGEPIGQNILPEAGFKKIAFFMHELSGLSIDPRQVEFSGSSTTPSEIYMTVVLSRGGKLIVNAADDLSAVLGNISAVISNKTIAPSLPQFLANLDYMKLDIGNKVVYKMKQK